MVSLLVIGRKLSGAVATELLRVRSTPPPPRLRRRERLLVDRDPHVDIELAPQVAEAGVDLLVPTVLVAVEGLSMAEAAVALPAGESL